MVVMVLGVFAKGVSRWFNIRGVQSILLEGHCPADFSFNPN